MFHYAQVWVGRRLSAGSFVVGLIGGTLYTQIILAINFDLPERNRELALSTILVGATLGDLLSSSAGLFIQSCLFSHLGISKADTGVRVAHLAGT